MSGRANQDEDLLRKTAGCPQKCSQILGSDPLCSAPLEADYTFGSHSIGVGANQAKQEASFATQLRLPRCSLAKELQNTHMDLENLAYVDTGNLC